MGHSRENMKTLRAPDKTSVYLSARPAGGLKSPAHHLKALRAGDESALADFQELRRGIYPIGIKLRGKRAVLLKIRPLV
jgi:hypothetical protein